MKIDFETSVTTIEGEPTNLEAYEGQVLLAVNTASQCGFTPSIPAGNAPHTLGDRGLAVLIPPQSVRLPGARYGKRHPVVLRPDMACRSRCLKRST